MPAAAVFASAVARRPLSGRIEAEKAIGRSEWFNDGQSDGAQSRRRDILGTPAKRLRSKQKPDD
jgi:hypothetical protein